MENPFEIIDRRLGNIEELLIEIKNKPASISDAEPFGDWVWLTKTCKGVPFDLLKTISESGEMPGVIRFGKRVLYDKQIVLNWIRSHTQ